MIKVLQKSRAKHRGKYYVVRSLIQVEAPYEIARKIIRDIERMIK